MDTYLYGLLGLSLAANAFSAISTLVANSKKRDEENQRTISSIYEELNQKIDKDIQGAYTTIKEEIRNLTLQIDDARRATDQVEVEVERMVDERVYDLETNVEKIDGDMNRRMDWMESEMYRLIQEINSEPELRVTSKKKHG